MCTKSPKIPKPETPKEIASFRNPFLDGMQIGAGRGRDALRTDLGGGLMIRQPAAPPPSGSSNFNPSLYEGDVFAKSLTVPTGSAAFASPGLVIPTQRF